MSLKINVSRSGLLACLGNLLNVTNKKGTIAILSNVLISSGADCIVVTSTDLEVAIQIKVPAEVVMSGAVTLPCRKLYDFIRESSAEIINLEERGNSWVNIKAELSDCNLAGMPPEEFPSFPEYDEAGLVLLPAELMGDLIDKTIFSIAQEEGAQFSFTSGLLEKETREDGNYLRMVTSDGHRLSLMERKVEDDISGLRMDRKIFIPRRGVQEIRRLCDEFEQIEFGLEDKQAVLKTGSHLLIIRLMGGEFPAYRGIVSIADPSNFIEVDKTILGNSMKRMSLFSDDKYNVVKMVLDRGQMILSSQSADIGNVKDEISVNYSGETINLYFNAKYFIDVLNVTQSDTVKLHISSEKLPCIIKNDMDPDFVSIIMPMKL